MGKQFFTVYGGKVTNILLKMYFSKTQPGTILHRRCLIRKIKHTHTQTHTTVMIMATLTKALKPILGRQLGNAAKARQFYLHNMTRETV